MGKVIIHAWRRVNGIERESYILTVILSKTCELPCSTSHPQILTSRLLAGVTRRLGDYPSLASFRRCLLFLLKVATLRHLVRSSKQCCRVLRSLLSLLLVSF